ncbi:hypothetical protein ABPG74_015729 [Tetrahymena malaccensis]
MSQNHALQIGAIGIDFGSSRSVIAVAKRGGVDVIANEASLRETRNIVGYGPAQRFTGEAANAQAKSNFKNTVSFFNRLLGLPANYPNLKNETKWISSKVGTNEEGKLVHEVQYKGQNVKLLPEQVTAAMLGDIRKIITLNNLPNHEAVISVPSYYTEQERKALRDACRIAGLNPLRLFNESSAICLSYGLFRKAELDTTTPRHVAFVDLGHSKFSAFVGAFTKEKLSIVSQVHERNLGARDMDWLVFQKYCKKFEQQHGLSVMESKKAQLRLLDAIEKQRKILSANSEADCNCEYLVEDCDLNESLTRTEFETVIQPVLARIKESINIIVEDLKSKKIELHSVEIIGGAVRIPAVQAIIQEAFNVPLLYKTLNQSECISRGCAMMSAMISPQFKVAQYNLEEANFYSIKMSWDFFNRNEKGEKMEQEGKTSVIFDKGCTVPNVKSITFNKNDGINVSLFYANPPEGFDAQLANFVIAPCKPKETEFGVKIKVKLDKDGLVNLEEAQLVEDYTVEEKIPVKKDKPAATAPAPAANGDQPAQQAPVQEPPIEYEIKQKKKTRHTDLSLEFVSQYYQQTKESLESLTNVQSAHLQSDNLIINTLNKKNELESFIYKWRSLISSSHQPYATPELSNQLNENLNQAESWLYDQGADSTLQEYSNRLEALQSLTVAIDRRFNQYTHLPEAINNLKNAIMTAENFYISNEEQYAHITKEDKKPLSDEIDRLRIWLNNADNVQKTIPLTSDPVVTIEEITNNINGLSNIYKQVASKPKPEPKKEEKPAADTKMQTEGDNNNQQNNNNNNGNANNNNMDIEQ